MADLKIKNHIRKGGKGVRGLLRDGTDGRPKRPLDGHGPLSRGVFDVSGRLRKVPRDAKRLLVRAGDRGQASGQLPSGYHHGVIVKHSVPY